MMRHAVMIILQKENEFLLGKRSSRKLKAPGYWCPISGHIKPNESEEDAVKREALEELGVQVRAIRKVASNTTHDQSIMLHWWVVELVNGTPIINNNENDEIRWFSKNELQELSPVFKEDIEILLKKV